MTKCETSVLPTGIEVSGSRVFPSQADELDSLLRDEQDEGLWS